MEEILLATIPATIPTTLAVLVGILLNQTGINRLDNRITSLEGRMASLESRFHEDILMLVGRDTAQSERLARLEERSKD